MRRRDVILGGALPLLGALIRPGLLGGAAFAASSAADGEPFEAQGVRDLARRIAAKDYVAPDRGLPAELDRLSYDDYRNIRFNAERALWRGEGLPFEMQLLHRGFLFRERVDLFLVVDGRARPIAYGPQLFRFEHGLKAPEKLPADFGFSGFRLHAALNGPDHLDEVAAFQGASYFRAVGKGQGYGSSARGLALKTGDPAGEEFPLFKAFWIERPRPDSTSVVVHALLDSPSAAAAYRFTIQPGETTTIAAEMTVYPRLDVDQPGLAPLTSMYFFGPNDHDGIDDFRPAVRDADGLSILTGRGEMLWRPLTNPQRLQISVFGDADTRGFGLMQRQRSFFDYQDLEARYERRPSVWVEPIGDWGEGAVYLVEIPTPEEIHDNIAAFWRPKQPLRKGGEYRYTYRLHWGWSAPVPLPAVRFGQTRVGGTAERRQFVVDVVGDDLAGVPAETFTVSLSASRGDVRDTSLQPHPEIEGLRLAFALEPQGEEVIELNARLMREGAPVSETWLYRWTP